jgi:hypothetical protein
MTSRLTFDLDTVCQLAEHAAAAAAGTNHCGTTDAGPALLLRSGSNGIWLTSNAAHPQPAPADQPGTLDRRAAFADQCPPGTPWLERVRLLRTEATKLTRVLPLDEPAGNPLLGQLRAASRAGATTVTVLLSGQSLDIAVGRRRTRPACGQTPPVDRQAKRWQRLLRRYWPLPRYRAVPDYTQLPDAARERKRGTARTRAVQAAHDYADLLAAEAGIAARAVYPTVGRLVFQLSVDVFGPSATLVAAYTADGWLLWHVDGDDEWPDESLVTDFLAAAVEELDDYFPAISAADIADDGAQLYALDLRPSTSRA